MTTVLQHDLNTLFCWYETWRTQNKLQKCVYICFARKKTPHVYAYTIIVTCLNQTFEHNYLGLYNTSDLSFRHRVNYVCAIACRVYGFLHRNARHFPVKTIELLYKNNLRPKLEFSYTVLLPRIKSDMEKLQK